MMKDRKDPRAGAKHGPMAERIENGSGMIPNDDAESEAHGAESHSAADRRIEGLLRIIGLQDNNDRELTEEEAELIFDIAEAEPVSEERLVRIRNGLLRRRFGTTPVPDETAIEGVPSSVASRAADSRVVGMKAPAEATRKRPSLVQHCRSVKRKLADVATELHLDKQTLFELDRGTAQSVPRALIDAVAITLKLQRDEVARCLAPSDQDVSRMAAHGRPRAQDSKPARPRDFLEVIEASRLPEEEKRYWRHIVAAESAASGRTPENS